MTHPLSIQPPGWDSPPEPTRSDKARDVASHVKEYLEAKEELKYSHEALNDIHESDHPEDIKSYFDDVERHRATMKRTKEYLWYHYGIEEENIERIEIDD